MKTDLFLEHIAHWFICIGLVAVLGVLVPAALVMFGGGCMMVNYLHAPLFGLDPNMAIIAYGVLAWIVFNVATRGWVVEQCINEWENLVRMHKNSLRTIKGRVSHA